MTERKGIVRGSFRLMSWDEAAHNGRLDEAEEAARAEQRRARAAAAPGRMTASEQQEGI